MCPVSGDQPSKVLGGLPNTRPHRRSDKRVSRRPESEPAAPAPTARRRTASTPRLRQPAQPSGVPKTPRGRPPAERPHRGPRSRGRTAASAPDPGSTRSPGRDILGTAARAAAELAEMGLSVSARALRNAVDRLPRP